MRSSGEPLSMLQENDLERRTANRVDDGTGKPFGGDNHLWIT